VGSINNGGGGGQADPISRFTRLGRDITVFGRIVADDTMLNSRNEFASASGSRVMVLVGGDKQISATTLFGVFGAYQSQSYNFDGAGSLNLNDVSTGVYGAYRNRAFHVDGSASISFSEASTNRSVAILGQSAVGAPKANYTTARIYSGYDFNLPRLGHNLTLTPEASLRTSMINMASWSEQGSDANLAMQSKNFSTVNSVVGMSAKWQSDWRGLPLSIRLGAGWDHAFMRSGPQFVSNFAQGQTSDFSINLPGLRQDALVSDAQLAWQIAPLVNVNVRAGMRLGAGGQDYSLSGGFNRRF
jgi:uncharacterized protein with beta-barrel porin domain